MKRFAVTILLLITLVAIVASCDDESTNPPTPEPTSGLVDLGRWVWHPASIPLDENNDSKPTDSRVAFYWYNIEAELGVHRRDLDPTLDEQENTLVESLDVELESAPASDPILYAGVMMGVKDGLDISEREYLEIWINDFKPDPLDRGGILHIDLGIMDENFYDPAVNVFNDEDQDRDGFEAASDDTGLDELFNADEAGTGEDPAGDDIVRSRINGRFSKINGTEGNDRYDTEDLDRNTQLGLVNGYFSYEIHLADSAVTDVSAQYPGYDGFNDAAHVNDSWRLYRVLLSDHVVRAPDGVQPSFDEIRHIRIWFDGLEEVVRTDEVGQLRVQIAEFLFAGSR